MAAIDYLLTIIIMSNTNEPNILPLTSCFAPGMNLADFLSCHDDIFSASAFFGSAWIKPKHCRKGAVDGDVSSRAGSCAWKREWRLIVFTGCDFL